MDQSEFESICPYSDEEAAKAFARISRHPAIPIISKYLYPTQPLNYLKNKISSVSTIDEFQHVVMSEVVQAIVDKTSDGFSFDGFENLRDIQGKFLAVSNHRDIILDPALTQWTLYREGLPMTEICVGSNLLSGPLVEDLLRCNKMIKVIRGISAREMYLSSKLLSRYIRQSITSGGSSVWIAQREGRTKNGLDTTEQGLLKMFDMSSEGSFLDGFKELNIVPMSISYEYEPCDARKARELYLKQRDGKYEKKPKEDLHSILTGIRQNKGHIHLSIGKPLTEDEILEAASWKGNDRYQAIRHILDERIRSGYKLWKTNYMAYDLMNGCSEYSDQYTDDDLKAFVRYTEHKLSKLERKLDRDALRDIFLHIYGNPVASIRHSEQL